MNFALAQGKVIFKKHSFYRGKQWGKKYASSYRTILTNLYNTKVERNENQNFGGKRGQNGAEKNLLPLQQQKPQHNLLRLFILCSAAFEQKNIEQGTDEWRRQDAYYFLSLALIQGNQIANCPAESGIRSLPLQQQKPQHNLLRLFYFVFRGF
ncbi:MAG: hypothetical protein EPO58_15720 [Chitinophagaceae bacterium]|nr:MAG: hypothetical protein EPO58_15720 [Chitinophagaceae bacterium]